MFLHAVFSTGHRAIRFSGPDRGVIMNDAADDILGGWNASRLWSVDLNDMNSGFCTTIVNEHSNNTISQH